MKKNGVYYDEDTGGKLVRPTGYKGLLYQKVTNLHKKYLKALGNIGVGRFVYYDEWIKECQNIGVKTKLPPGTMTHGVFESRGYVEVQKDNKTKLNLYRLTDKGRGYLEGFLEIPTKCRELRVAKWLPWWCRRVCTRTDTKLCYWLCKPLGKAR